MQPTFNLVSSVGTMQSIKDPSGNSKTVIMVLLSCTLNHFSSIDLIIRQVVCSLFIEQVRYLSVKVSVITVLVLSVHGLVSIKVLVNLRQIRRNGF